MVNKLIYGIELEGLVEYDEVPNVRDDLTPIIMRPGFRDIRGDLRGDGSISTYGTERGVEVVTQPLPLPGLLMKVREVSQVLERHNFKVNKSCGFHVHTSHPKLDKVKYLKRVIHTWLAIEDVLISTQPPSRLNNSYCVRVLKQYIDGAVTELPNDKQRIISKIQSYSQRSARYHALNIMSLSRHNTLEVRLHGGTREYNKIASWLKLLDCFYSYCLSSKYRSREITRLLKLPISNDKVKQVFDLLELPQEVRRFYLRRIRTLLFSHLNKQLEVAFSLDDLKKKKEAIAKRYDQIRRQQLEVVREIDDNLGVFNARVN